MENFPFVDSASYHMAISMLIHWKKISNSAPFQIEKTKLLKGKNYNKKNTYYFIELSVIKIKPRNYFRK